MEEENFKYRMPMYRTIKNPSTFHFSSFFLDNVISKNRQYQDFSKSPELEKEYQAINENKIVLKEKSIINLTSEELKNKYITTYNYYNNGLNQTLIISILLIICIFLEIKYFEPSETNIAILILSSISLSFCFTLIINIKGKALIDTYGYVPFYLFSMIESILFLCLFIFKIANFILIYNKLNGISYSKKIKRPGYFIYLLILMINFIIIFWKMCCFKFIYNLFIDGFNILILKHKTLFQEQIELDESKNKGSQIEFVDDKNESINSSLNQFNSQDEIKID